VDKKEAVSSGFLMFFVVPIPLKSPFAYETVFHDFINGQACLPEGRGDKARMKRRWLFRAHPSLDAILPWKMIYDFQRGN
jgi:hypothetical protein